MMLQQNNNATKFRREILVHIIKAFNAQNLSTEIDKIPHRISPKNGEEMRCCLYKDRAVLRLRCLAALGLAVEDDEDDATTLAEYLGKALKRTAPQAPVMTMLDIACKGCVARRYFVTDACQTCLARPCSVNCPVNAITVTKTRAIIDYDKCIHCGKCKDVCPYSAIIRIPVPCEEACPVDAIKKQLGDGRAVIDFAKCISCGRCMRACPFGAVMEKSQVLDIMVAIKANKKVISMVAPAIVGQFNCELTQIAQGLKNLGFAEVIEVAIGADITTKKEAEEFVERMAHGAKLMTTSCCSAYIETVKRHLPELKSFVSDTHTPMHYTAEIVKQKYPDAVTVFIGPCVAKRKEGFDNPLVDYVMTFEEVGAWFVAADIEACLLDDLEMEKIPSAEGRGYAVTGGVANAVKKYAAAHAQVEVKPEIINGLNLDALKKLKKAASGEGDGNLIEVMACEGGCIGGAGVVARSNLAKRAIDKLCGETFTQK